MRARACLIFALCFALPAAAAATLEVQVSGAVAHPGKYPLPAGSRFADAVLAAMPDSQAGYPLGAAVLRTQAVPAQLRLKAGLLFDLKELAAAADRPASAARLEALHDWVQAMPVTGRVRGQLDPRRLEVDRANNRVLASGDRFHYPRRPTTIAVVGAVDHFCTLPHAPLRDAGDYLADCPTNALADRDLLFVIQPDGQVQRLGIAAWNRMGAQSLAPGATIYVPLQARVLHGVADSFNDDLAQFLATQLLPEPSP